MNVTLTIQENLKDLRTERGLTLEQLEQQTGISKSALGNYESDDFKDISHIGIVALAKFYGASTDYLLGPTETKNHPNTELNDLHLSDEMRTLLKSRKINTRLLCEMAVHRDFLKLLSGIETYVDGIASMQGKNLNAFVDMARIEIMKKYYPAENDPHIRLLSAVHIDGDTYFCQMVHRGIDSIIRYIRRVTAPARPASLLSVK